MNDFFDNTFAKNFFGFIREKRILIAYFIPYPRAALLSTPLRTL